MKLLLVVLAFVGLALADVKEGKYVKEEKYHREEKHGVYYNKQYSYHGKYNGKCDKDGFYFKDDHSFVICSNNNAYEQPCAPGSKNSAYERYHYGETYYYRDFCDINLVDHGYGVKHYGGYDNKAPHYEEPKQPHVSYTQQYQYHGKYSGKCAKDGFYYNNDASFVICSNDNAYVQACAPGSRNSGYSKYHRGSAYYYRDFCDINLVDHGYGVHYGGYGKQDHDQEGYGRRGYGHEEPHYGGEYQQYERREHYGYGRNDGYGYNSYEAGYGKPSFYGKARTSFPYWSGGK